MKRYNLLILLIVLLVVSCQTKSPNHCDEMLSTYKTGEVLRMKHHINEDTFEIRTYYKNGILAQRGNVIITKDDYYRKYGYWYYYYSNGNEAYKRYFSSGMDLQYYSFDDPATANIACHINIPLSTTC